MKRKLLLAVLAIVVTVSCAVGLAACDLFGEETSHKHQMQHVDAVAATCTEEGNTEYWYCSDCGKYFTDAEGKNEIADLNSTVISAKGHSWSEWETAKAATCTEDGYKERECSVCHETEQETITATGHTFSEDWSHDGTCHWHAATCEHSDQVSDKAEHSWDNGVVTKQPSCTEDGETTYTCTVCERTKTAVIPATGHTFSKDWSHDGTYHWHAATCEHSDQVSDKAEHSWDNGVVTKQPSCTEDGEMTYTCTVCEETKTAVIPATGHTFSEDWSHDGTYHWHACLNCGDAGEKTEHTFKNDICFVCNAPKQNVGLQYSLNSDGQSYSVTGISTCTDTEIIIPSVYNGLPVTSVGSGAFKDCGSLADITIPDSVTSIGSSAFGGCGSLTSMTVPFVGASKDGTSNTHFGYIFGANIYLDNPDCIPASLKTVIITGGNSIGNSAFHKCASLTSITIPDNVTSIGGWAFLSCSSLTDINIPDGVTSIGESAFDGCSSLTSITIPDSVTSIWSSTFFNCSSLKSITLPDSVTSIGNSAFYGCSSLTSITIPDNVTSIGSYAFYNCAALTGITIPGSVKSIATYSFYGCTSLKSINISDGVKSIGSSAFKGCSALTSVTIGDSLASIGSSAFYGCSLLTDITVPDSVTSIESSAFRGCSSLASMTIPFVGERRDGTSQTHTHFGYIFGAIFVSDNSDYIPESLKTVIITGGDRIGDSAFIDCDSLTGITLPDSVKSIGSYAFSGCSSLTNFTIPDNVISIGEYAFSGCNNIIQTENGISYVGKWAIGCDATLNAAALRGDTVGIANYAFYNCLSLTSITIPSNVISIGNRAFENCYKLAEVYNLSSLNIIKGSTSNGYVAYYALNVYTADEGQGNLQTTDDGYIFYEYEEVVYLIGYIGTQTELALPDTFNGKDYQIYNYAFYNFNTITGITIPDSVNGIGKSAFEGCFDVIRIENGISYADKWAIGCDSSLSSAILRSDTVGIADNAFYGCSSLTSMALPDGVKNIGRYAFYGCTSLESITIPDSVTSIGSSAFESCILLEKVNITDIAAWCGISFQNFYSTPLCHGFALYLNGELVTELTLPDSVTSIGNYAFSGCRSLTSIAIPDGITSIGDYTFYKCVSLTSMTIPEGVTSIGDSAFEGCSSLESITIPDSVTSIGSHAFSLCSALTSITIPDGVTSIGDSAFSACSSLTSITIPDNVTSIGNRAFSGCSALTGITLPDSVTSIGKYAFYNCSSLTGITIPDNVTSIGSWTFSDCGSLTSITIPDSVTSIEKYAFEGCSSLTGIIIPDSVTSIGNSAFSRCSSLESITIPDSVTSIGDYAFFNCSSLASMTLPDGVTSIENYAFSGCGSLESITIPDSVTSIGNSAFSRCSSLTSVTFENTSGWQYTSSSTATSGTSIPESDLADPSAAATCLTSAYCNYYWKRA